MPGVAPGAPSSPGGTYVDLKPRRRWTQASTGIEVLVDVGVGRVRRRTGPQAPHRQRLQHSLQERLQNEVETMMTKRQIAEGPSDMMQNPRTKGEPLLSAPRRRLHGHDYTSPGLMFVTFCTKERRPALGKISEDGGVMLSPIGVDCRDHAKALPGRFLGYRVDELMIMPDHVHVLLALGQEGTLPKADLSRVIRWWKGRTSSSATRRGFPAPFWQRSFYDRIVRDEDEAQRIRKYMKNNPLRWMLKEREKRLQDVRE